MSAVVSIKDTLLSALIPGESYGLELIDRVKERTGGKIVLHQGTVYPALRALEREGLVETWEADPLPERGGRPRRYYRLTAEGAKQAAEVRTAMVGFFGSLVQARVIICTFFGRLALHP